MAIFRRSNLFSSSPSLFSRLRTLVFEQQRCTQTSTGEGGGDHIQDAGSFFPLREGAFDTTNWKTADSRTLGIRRSAISSSTWTVLKILQGKGFEVYLVGGCVRDLILGKTPKDFDVVTTATLAQIKKQFRRCIIVGSRFPICQVYVFGSKIEVSSFETIAIDAQKREKIKFSQMPNNCEMKDFVRWKDSMRRDFTINGLLYDPFVNTIYDYVDGIRDVMASEVRTVIPAYLSFKEDCARILRGLRIAARLGLRFSKETATAIQDLSWSIVTLSKPRLMMELDFMLAYGAAVPSISLLQKYKLLDVILPIQAAYLADQAKKQSIGSSVMLMKLFSHLDRLLATDRPSSCGLWLGLLAFHLALVNHPQNALVIWTFSSILYLGTWDRGIKFVRERVRRHVKFIPEVLDLSEAKSDELLLEETESDDSLLEKTSYLASLIKSSVNALTKVEALHESLAKYEMTMPCSDVGHLIFVSERAGRNVAKLFDVFEGGIKSYAKERETFDINYELLKKGDLDETRFVLGKIILDTLNSELTYQDNQNAKLINQLIQNVATMKKRELGTPVCEENATVEEVKNELNRETNSNETAVKKRCLHLASVFDQLCQNATVMKKGEIAMPARKENAIVEEVKSELVRENNNKATTLKKRHVRLSSLFDQLSQNATIMKDRELAMPAHEENAAVEEVKREVISENTKKPTAVKRRHLHLASLFE